MTGLPDPIRTGLLRAAARVPGTGPLSVVVVSDAYAIHLDNWLRHVRRLGLRRLLVVAMDAALARRLDGSGLCVATGAFDGSEADFWLQRTLVWACLSEAGYDIIQSDIDALWLRNPIARYLTDPAFDVVFTQGTFLPMPVWEQWGFVLCTGLFAARSCPATRGFFDAITAPEAGMRQTDDQSTINATLARLGVAWRVTDNRARRMMLWDQPMTVFDRTLAGYCAALDLRIGMLPHRLFPRVPGEVADAYVVHELRPEDSAARVPALRARGLWLVPDDGSA